MPLIETEEAARRLARAIASDISLYNGGVLRVTRVQPDGGKKVPAAEWARAVNLQPGGRFT